jgi:molybdopterin molybdotransferase
MSLLPVETALERILGHVPAVVGERVALAAAFGRVLAAPISASHDQPPFSASAMDGYALRSADLEPNVSFRNIGISQAGAGFVGTVGRGETVRIFTGAPMPDGADVVIMQEEAVAGPDGVTFSAPAEPGKNIRPRGYDFSSGAILLDAGRTIDPFGLALIAAANVAELEVARRPRIGLVSTGDELVSPGTPLRSGQIVSSNAVALAGLVRPFTEDVIDYGIARDTVAEHRQLFEAAFSGGVDVLITTGGASVGDHDIVQAVLQDCGVDIDFWRINMRPGKPLMVGTRGSTLVFGLPGNPVSALVTATVFILPALRRWLGLADPAPLRLPLAAPTPPNSARRHFMRASFVEHDGRLSVMPITQTDSGHISSLASADALIIQPENDPGQQISTLVSVLPLPRS